MSERRVRLYNRPIEPAYARERAVQGDRWRVCRAVDPDLEGRRVWLAGPREIGVYATRTSKYVRFLSWTDAMTYAIARAAGDTRASAIAHGRAVPDVQAVRR